MLTPTESKVIEHEGFSTMHDYWFNSLFAGEPFLHDGVLVYYDGRIATICGFPMRHQSVIEAGVSCHVAKEWVTHHGAENIIYMGPDQVDFGCLNSLGLRQVWENEPRPNSAELFIDCAEADSIFKSRLYRRSRSLPFELTVRSGGTVSAEHFLLIEKFYSARDLTAFLAEMLFVLPILMRSSRVQLIEARQDGRLSGFVMIHRPFCDTAVGLFMMCSGSSRGVSDFLYSAMVEQARALGVAYLNLGPSPSAGHFNFKLKWAGKPRVPPYYFVQWGRGGLGRRFHTAWGPRILRLRKSQ